MKRIQFWALLGIAGFNLQANTITNCAPITTCLYFKMAEAYGAYTNTFQASDQIAFLVASTPETNAVFYRSLPEKQSFDFRLLDSLGEEVPKTKKGVVYSQPVTVPDSIGAVARLKGRYTPRLEDLFRPDEMFIITNKGSYQMELRLRIWAQTTNMPGANYEIIGHFEKDIGTNAQFGVVVSEPVRVSIIKK